jgi:hypothetical protein
VVAKVDLEILLREITNALERGGRPFVLGASLSLPQRLARHNDCR